MNKQQLASKIWESANKMRSKIEANEYKDYILGFIFYKFLSDKEVKYLKETDWTDEYLPELKEDDEEIVKSIQKNIGYFISYENLFSTWIKKGIDFTAADVTNALLSFNRFINDEHRKVFTKIFDTLQTGLSKLGETSNARTKAIRDLIYLINDIPMDGKQDYDVLGFVYEYLISNFAANAGKKAGEFYTPHEVSLLMSEIVANHLKDRSEIEIYDPTSGSGSLLINIGSSAAKYIPGENKIKYYAQELKENTYNLTRMNLVMRGILPDNIITRNGDTLEDDWPYFDENDKINTYNPLFVDAVVSNPPYSQPWTPDGKDNDPRFNGYGIAPKGKADYAFLLHDLYHLKGDGIMTIVLPHGVLFRGGEEGTIRKNLIEKNNIDTIIGLPANIFFGTGIPTIIMVLKKKKEDTSILFVDASKGFAKVGKNNVLRSRDIKKIVDVVIARKTEEKFSKLVSLDEIRKNDYNLNIPRYVDSSEEAETWDIYASMFGGIPKEELSRLDDYWKAFPSLKDALFKEENPSYVQLKEGGIDAIISDSDEVKAFKDSYKEKFSDLETFLKTELIEGIDNENISKEEETIARELFSRLENIPIIDKYTAYQILDDNWKIIQQDVESLQTEGLKALSQVDPETVMKKKDGKDQEIVVGEKGHIIPFSLVQETHLSSELKDLKNMENELASITSRYEELLEEIPEDEKEKDFVNEDKDSFVLAQVKKAIKAKDVDEDVLNVLKEVNKTAEREKELKSQIKKGNDSLQKKTKAIIENLSEEEALSLLGKKWFNPLIEQLSKLPEAIISDLSGKIKALSSKYETTLSDLDREIRSTEKELISLLDELTGSEYDMKGIEELKILLGGGHND